MTTATVLCEGAYTNFNIILLRLQDVSAEYIFT